MADRAPRDPRILRAVHAVNAALAKRWTVHALARVAGMSRAAFARAFVAEIGAPPLAFVTRARMQRASALLIRSDKKLAEVANEVGYASEFALSRAFRRTIGLPPSVFRRAAANDARTGSSTTVARAA